MPAIGSSTMGNAAGVLQYCVKNNYLGGDAASVKDKLLAKITGQKPQETGFNSGAKGLLKGGDGQTLNFKGAVLEGQDQGLRLRAEERNFADLIPAGARPFPARRTAHGPAAIFSRAFVRPFVPFVRPQTSMTPAVPSSSLRQRLARWVPCLAWPRPSAALLRNEAMAGITVALMVIPQGVAYAALAGMPLVTGVYAALFPALIAVMFSSSQRLSVGPTALTSLLVGASLAPLAVAGSAEWVAMAVWLTLMSGTIQIVLGAGRFGWLLRLVNSPVLIGFTQGAAVLIAISQLPALLGFTGRTIPQVLQGGPLPDLVAIAFGLGSIAVLWLGKRMLPRFPTTMALVAGAAAISWGVDYALRGGAVVGSLPSGLPSFYWPGLLQPGPGGPRRGQAGVRPVRQLSHQHVLLALGHHAVLGRQDGLGDGGRRRHRAAGAAVPHAGPLLRAAAVLSAVVVAAVFGLVKPRVFRQLWQVDRVEAMTAAATAVITVLSAPSSTGACWPAC
jgi:SulP family sulfate permease